MAKKLLSDSLRKITHIALILAVAITLQTAKAQTVLLPGDIVVVSVEADSSDSAFDFIPLIDIEKGTSVYFTNGSWDNSKSVLNGEEFRIDFTEDLDAGTSIHISNGISNNSAIETTGALAFEGKAHRLLAYQKEAEQYRFIYGIGWGHSDVWKKKSDIGSGIPVSLSVQNHTLISLGNASKYQYYIRNGASGTRAMLLKFVAEPAHWRSIEKRDVSVFGTSFNLLAPPVILFDESISVATENSKSIQLKVAIYEHDGSKLTVDVEYDSSLSTSNYEDIARFKGATINFTGLIGDGIYEINIPLADDNNYEGKETAFFELKNLSQGSFGDFLSHSLIIYDDELPDIEISSVNNISKTSSGFVTIRNNEDQPVSLSGWVLSDAKNGFIFDKGTVINPGQSIRVFNREPGDNFSVTGEHNYFASVKNLGLNQKGGEVRLTNDQDRVVSTFKYEELEEVSGKESEVYVLAGELASEQQKIGNRNTASDQQQESSTRQILNPGWRLFNNPSGLLSTFSGNNFYFWTEEDQTFINADDAAPSELEGRVLFGYFESESLEKLSGWFEETNKNKALSPAELEFRVSATDKDENGVIDGYEGFNLIRNTLNNPVSVYSVVNEMMNKSTDLDVDPVVHTIQRNLSGQIEYRTLRGNDLISPSTSFLVKLNAPVKELNFSLDASVLSSEPIPEDEPENADEANISLTLSHGPFTKNLTIDFNTLEEKERTRDINSYSKLRVSSNDFLAFAIQQGSDFFNRVEYAYELENSLSLPVSFSTSNSGTFTLKTSNWEGIPEEWQVLLVDKVTDEELELSKDFSYDFDYFNESMAEETGNDLAAEDGFEKQERFELKIVLPQEETEEPTEIELRQNFPNPFNPITTISFYLPEPTEVKLSVFNIVGQPVAVLIDEGLSAGDHQVDWDASDRPSGMYIYQLEVGNKIMTRKMTLVK